LSKIENKLLKPKVRIGFGTKSAVFRYILIEKFNPEFYENTKFVWTNYLKLITSSVNVWQTIYCLKGLEKKETRVRMRLTQAWVFIKLINLKLIKYHYN